MLATAPMRRPPALPPSAATLSGDAYFCATRARVTSIKSVKVFFLLRRCPSSYQDRPISCPPRMWAMA